MIFSGEIDELRGEIVETSLNAGDRPAVLQDNFDGSIPRSDVGVRRDDRIPEIFDASLAAYARQVRSDAATLASDAVALPATSLAPERLLARRRIALYGFATVAGDGSNI